MSDQKIEITEVRVRLTPPGDQKVKAFCSITIMDSFVVRDLKVIESDKGRFLAMPSRKLADKCGNCSAKNPLTARFCNQCGSRMRADRATQGVGRPRLHSDLAHPINKACRDYVERTVLEAYDRERKRAELDDYEPPSFDDFEDDGIASYTPLQRRIDQVARDGRHAERDGRAPDRDGLTEGGSRG